LNETRHKYALIIPLLVLAAGTVVSWMTDVDMRLAHWFFDPQSRVWPGSALTPFLLANKYGQLVGWIPALLGIGVLLASIWKKDLARHRRWALFLVLLLAIGPGLIVNPILKDQWGRPRPSQVEEFGGRFEYQPAWFKAEPGDRRTSFPSGHAAMGFFFTAPYFILLARRRRAAHAWLIGGVAFGIFVGLARMAKGAHWASDILWSFGVVYLVAYGLARWLKLDEAQGP
jgi:membrane-associated PAP2 superfamily phosphatase